MGLTCKLHNEPRHFLGFCSKIGCSKICCSVTFWIGWLSTSITLVSLANLNNGVENFWKVWMNLPVRHQQQSLTMNGWLWWLTMATLWNLGSINHVFMGSSRRAWASQCIPFTNMVLIDFWNSQRMFEFCRWEKHKCIDKKNLLNH